MSNLDFFVTFCMGPIALTLVGIAMYAFGVREQKRYLAEHMRQDDDKRSAAE